LADERPDPIKHLNALPDKERLDLLTFIKVSADPTTADEAEYLRAVMRLKGSKPPEQPS